MCLAEMLIKGQNEGNIVYQDTMKADRFPDIKMRFVLENPPFGQAWGGKDAAEGVEKAVQDEYAKGFDGRWGRWTSRFRRYADAVSTHNGGLLECLTNLV